MTNGERKRNGAPIRRIGEGFALLEVVDGQLDVSNDVRIYLARTGCFMVAAGPSDLLGRTSKGVSWRVVRSALQN